MKPDIDIDTDINEVSTYHHILVRNIDSDISKEFFSILISITIMKYRLSPFLEHGIDTDFFKALTHHQI
jgi:hypothetical protein